MTTPYFAPSVGGIETMTETLAEEFVRRGHVVTVATQTAGDSPSERAYPVVRRPTARVLWRLVREADVVLQNQPSLRLGWPAVLQGRPLVISHHMWTAKSGKGAWLGCLKHRYFRCAAANVCVSSAMARSLSVPSVVVPNPYRNQLFISMPDVARDDGLVFLGRLVPDKGARHAIETLSLLHSGGRRIRLTIVGTGPQEQELRNFAAACGLAEFVTFTGALGGESLVRELHRHRVLLVPSIWDEPFGLVALEGMACGLCVVASDSGGLPEAVGAAGIVVPKGDTRAMASAVDRLLGDPPYRSQVLAAVSAHLARHGQSVVADHYVRVLRQACGAGA